MRMKPASAGAPLLLAALRLRPVDHQRPRLPRRRHRQHDPAGPARRRRRPGARRQALLAPAAHHLRHQEGAEPVDATTRRSRAPRRGPIGERLRPALTTDGSVAAAGPLADDSRLLPPPVSPARSATATAAVFYRDGRVFRTLSAAALANWRQLAGRRRSSPGTGPRAASSTPGGGAPRPAARARRAGARAHPLRLLSLRMALRHAEGCGAAASRADARRARRGHDPEGLLRLQHPVERRAAGLHRHPVLRGAAAAASPGSATGSSASSSSTR